MYNKLTVGKLIILIQAMWQCQYTWLLRCSVYYQVYLISKVHSHPKWYPKCTSSKVKHFMALGLTFMFWFLTLFLSHSSDFIWKEYICTIKVLFGNKFLLFFFFFFFFLWYLAYVMWKRIFGHMGTAKAQINLLIHAVWSGPSLSTNIDCSCSMETVWLSHNSCKISKNVYKMIVDLSTVSENSRRSRHCNTFL